MNIQIQSINFTLPVKLKQFIASKVEKLISINDSLINADIYLKVERPESHDNKIVEIKMQSSNGFFFAKKQSDTFEESADLVTQALRKQIIKNKNK
jgi:putative sigma-54 modulation protein